MSPYLIYSLGFIYLFIFLLCNRRFVINELKLNNINAIIILFKD